VFAAFADKDVEGIVAPLAGLVHRWHVAGLADESPRGVEASETARRVRAALPTAEVLEHADVAAALAAARAGDEGRLVLTFGSFHTVAAALRAIRQEPR
jgi:dihydrofolate synthase/folylpolyglutamate synthase